MKTSQKPSILQAGPTPPASFPSTAKSAPPLQLGITAASYGQRLRANHPSRFHDAIEILRHCHGIGMRGAQLSIGDWTPDFIARMRKALDELGMYFEGQVGLPRHESDLPRFTQRIRIAREVGATIVRTVALGGRRYETFATAEDFQEFVKRSWQSFRWAEPVMRKHGVQLAVENHKDWLIPGLLDIMHTMSSEYIGVCVDFGNSISLLEDPMEVVRAYAPHALTTHCKDMAVLPYEGGFFLSEVPLGKGILDLHTIIDVLRKANPRITFNLEMITRDPLRVPCLQDSYWKTLTHLRARSLARALALVQSRATDEPLPSVAGLDETERIAFEESNNLASLNFAKRRLGFV